MIQLNYRDPRPIYEQIKDSFRKLVVSKAILPDEKLPSVRELAASLAINPNTIQRAYRELENEGYIYSIPGKGSFAALKDDVRSERTDSLWKTLDEILQELLFLGIKPKELEEHVVSVTNPAHRKESEND